MDDETRGVGCAVLIVAAIILLPLGGCSLLKCVGGIPMEYSSGERTGVVYKISRTGYLFKTNEGQMNLGGMKPTKDGAVANIWDFSVTDKSVLDKLGTAAKNGDVVTVKYVQPWMMAWSTGDSGYLATEVVDKAQSP